ncbi:hypothetical protein FRC06_000553 [Ceratobasidium sp. 370]|nr:hypothetical protein FRC06_000553 [Ceratobasidium sp. 370]
MFGTVAMQVLTRGLLSLTQPDTQIVSQYAYSRPKGMHWSPKPLALAKRYPLRPIAERTSTAKRSTAPQSVQPVVKVQDEYHEEGSLIEAETEGTLE